MRPTLRERLIHIVKITENQPEEDILTILKTVIQEYEGKIPKTNQQAAVKQFNQGNIWRKGNPK